jgi:hypothetical protein
MAEYQHIEYSTGFTTSIFNESLPGGRRLTPRELLSVARAKGFSNWLLGWFYAWRGRDVQGPGIPMREGLIRNVSQNNALLAYLKQKSIYED